MCASAAVWAAAWQRQREHRDASRSPWLPQCGPSRWQCHCRCPAPAPGPGVTLCCSVKCDNFQHWEQSSSSFLLATYQVRQLWRYKILDITPQVLSVCDNGPMRFKIKFWYRSSTSAGWCWFIKPVSNV
jgi:hypothetical protein